MPDSRYVKTFYLILKVLDEYGQINWVTEVRQLLFQMVLDIYGQNDVCIILVRFCLLKCNV